MQAQEFPGTRAGVLLKQEAFDLITGTLGAYTELARANLLGVDPKTIYRVRRGIVGEEFIARALHVMHENSEQLRAIDIEPSFEAMFSLGEKPVTA